MGEYTVQDNDWLQKIAKDHGLRTEDALVQANPDLEDSTAGNYDVLSPGTTLVIPDLSKKQVAAATGQRHDFQLRGAVEDLVVTLQTATGMLVVGTWTLTPGGGAAPAKSGDLSSAIRYPKWPIGVTEANLEIQLTYTKDNPKDPDMGICFSLSETIKLQVGGLDPLTGSDDARAKAAQKILTNLGFYGGPIDGDLTTPKSRAAILKFQAHQKIQPTDDLLDQNTANALLQEQTGAIGNSGAPFPPKANDRDLPITFDAEAEETTRNFTSLFSDYVEPTDPVQSHTRKFADARFFPRTAYVAVSDAGTRQNPNIIRMRSRKFIFVDSGRWLKAGRDFTIIWGRHAYLCEFVRSPQGDAPALNRDAGRLDYIFFLNMGANVKVKTYASANWAAEDEFDWNKLILIVPDLHLMTGPNGAIFRGKDFKNLDPELDLLLFTKKLLGIGALQGSIEIIQLGDSYDLWVGCEPRLFRENEDQLVELYQPSKQRWSCGALACPGHPSAGVLCESGKWKCQLTSCPGHHDSAGERCHPDRSESQIWTCGRIAPPCTYHYQPDIACEDGNSVRGSLWRCFKMDPPCPGHHTMQGACPDHIDVVAQLRGWVNDIRGSGADWVKHALDSRDQPLPDGIELAELVKGDEYWNPACIALDQLEKAGATYLWGNHDNYLALLGLTSQIGVAKRHKLFQTDGILIEHGQRLEARLIGSGDQLRSWHYGGVPTNYDGSVSGYDATLEQYHEQEQREIGEKEDTGWFDRILQWKTREWLDAKENGADKLAQYFQQTQYMEEFAQVWMGRWTNGQLPAPHIFGIGHTHDPLLAYVNIHFNFD